MIELIAVLLKKKIYWSMIAFFLCACMISYFCNNLLDTANLLNKTSINAFYFSVMKSNTFAIVLAPLFAIMGAYDGIFLNARERLSVSKVFSVGVVGGSVLLIPQLIVLVLCKLIFGADAYLFPYYSTFVDIYNHSIVLFVLLVLINSFVIGFVYSFLSLAISYKAKNSFLAIIIPMLFYSSALFIPFGIKELYDFVPLFTYDIDSISRELYQHIVSILIVIIIALIIMVIKIRFSRSNTYEKD